MPGESPGLAQKLDLIYCVLLGILNSGGSGQSGIQTFANAAARDAATPDFAGQLGYQIDTQAYVTGLATVPGGWTGQFNLGGPDAGSIALLDGSAGNVGFIQMDTLTTSQLYLLPNSSGTVDLTP